MDRQQRGTLLPARSVQGDRNFQTSHQGLLEYPIHFLFQRLRQSLGENPQWTLKIWAKPRHPKRISKVHSGRETGLSRSLTMASQSELDFPRSLPDLEVELSFFNHLNPSPQGGSQ
jgi:hypothetical protein